MRNAVACTALVAALAVPARASAWGLEAHKYITRRAIDLLPSEVKRFYEAHREEVVLRTTDPDLWRNVGWNEEPNHFLDLGAKEYGEYPFAALPRDLGAAVEKFGMSTLQRNGMLPWRAAELFGSLRRTFEGFARGRQFGSSDAVLFAGALAHYVQDAHQPLHGTINYDGQLTGNTGIHSRFEGELFERFQSRLTVTPAAAKPITNPRDAVFDALLAGYKAVEPILKADSDAVAGKDVYDDDYFEKLFAGVRPVLEQRLSESISATAGAIAGAWELAGRPSLAGGGPRPVQRVKKPEP
jgi:hypothetical protein